MDEVFLLADRRVTNLCNRVDLGGVGDALRVRAITRLIFIGHLLPADQIMERPRELNSQPPDYKSGALPIELGQQGIEAALPGSVFHADWHERKRRRITNWCTGRDYSGRPALRPSGRAVHVQIRSRRIC